MVIRSSVHRTIPFSVLSISGRLSADDDLCVRSICISAQYKLSSLYVQRLHTPLYVAYLSAKVGCFNQSALNAVVVTAVAAAAAALHADLRARQQTDRQTETASDWKILGKRQHVVDYSVQYAYTAAP